MSGQRFDLSPIVRGHWRGLTDGRLRSAPADILSRAVVLAVPLATTAAAWWLDWRLYAPSALLAGVALLTGGLLGAFTHLGTLRMKVTERRALEDDDAMDQHADMLDESAAHLLMATLVAFVDAVLLVIGMNLAGGANRIAGFWAALIIGVSCYLALLFVLCLPRLYAAYVQMNSVRSALNGFVRR